MHASYGERALAAAVILRAVEDATTPLKPLIYRTGRKRPVQTGDITAKDKADAFAFLTSMSPEWRTSRALWCSLAGMEETKVRSMMLAGTVLPIRR